MHIKGIRRFCGSSAVSRARALEVNFKDYRGKINTLET
jgi:hypothetical protein